MPKKNPTQRQKTPYDHLIDLAQTFLDSNPELSQRPKGMAIEIRPSGTDGLKMTIAMPGKLNRTQYVQAWPTINEWLKRLTAFAGRHDFTPQEQLLRQLAAKHPQRSYAQLADEMNQRIETLLRIMLRGHHAQDKNQFLMAGYLLQRNLRALHVKPCDLQQSGAKLTRPILEAWILECCHRLAEGQPTFSVHPPITRDHVRTCLRTQKTPTSVQ